MNGVEIGLGVAGIIAVAFDAWAHAVIFFAVCFGLWWSQHI